MKDRLDVIAFGGLSQLDDLDRFIHVSKGFFVVYGIKGAKVKVA